MNILKKTEVRLALFLGGFAFILSPVIGLVSGISLGLVIIRTLLMTLIFGSLGAGALFVFKRFVPEIYAVIHGAAEAGDQNPEEIDTGFSEDAAPSEEDGEPFDADAPPADGPNEPAGAGSSPDLDSMAPGNVGSGSKMGKHILEEKGMKFEPKIMAEAVRTMMSRDDD